MKSQTALYTVVLFLTAFAMLFWYSSGKPALNPAAVVEEDNAPDFFLSDVVVREFSDTGNLSYSIEARRMEHYPVSDSASIDQPLITLYPAKQDSQWLAQAEHAEVEKSGKLLILRDSVTLYNNKPEQSRVTMKADTLTINIEQETAYTDSAVLIENAMGQINSKGIEANLVTNTLKLKSQVAGFISPSAAR